MNCLIPLLLLYYICGCNSPATAAIMSSLPNPGRKAGGCYESQFGHIRSNETVTIPDACVQINTPAMKNFIPYSLPFSLLCLLFLQSMVIGSVTRDTGCYLDSVGHFKTGEQKSIPGQCSLATCDSGGSFSVVICPEIQIDTSGCHLGKTDFSKPYPECCPKVICTKS
ncbi:hypothetical protein Zmor_005057 [Zophobas morio]|uniref:Single domain-containing protein n=1 Tax=Zophobas morio TaxID=2755281 RepID=A0AA38ISR2_9CUCU|nr:hypothetical protein Zmor_005057 [Zophobas morio]